MSAESRKYIEVDVKDMNNFMEYSLHWFGWSCCHSLMMELD